MGTGSASSDRATPRSSTPGLGSSSSGAFDSTSNHLRASIGASASNTPGTSGNGSAGGQAAGGAAPARSGSPVDPAFSGVTRACDQCRIRKIRCDKESPCANCRIANRMCSSTGVGQKPREAKQRVLISTQYERKIDQIEERLTSIEELLRQLIHTTTNNNASAANAATPMANRPTTTNAFSQDRFVPNTSSSAIAPSEHSQHSPNSSPAGPEYDDTGAGTPSAADLLDSSAFEGHSSLTAHTQFASEFLEHAVERTSLRDLSPNMAAALSSLRQIVGLSQQQRGAHNNVRRGSNSSNGRSGEVRFAHQRILPRGGFRELPMPPVTAVIPVLREIKETPPGTFTLISVCCFMAVENFAEACRRVYFALDDFSQATFIIVNMGLYYLFQEKSVTADSQAAVAEYTSYFELCRDNLETGLAHLKFFLGASMETIEALLLGASYAIEVSRPSLAWQLNTTAAQLCQDLGYHRVTGGVVEPAAPDIADLNDKKAILFWFSYMLDRGLALRLGRAPIIQDFDVTLPRVVGQRVKATETWKESLRLWIAHADLQGQIYAKLYSPTSLAQPVRQRVEVAQTLAGRLKRIAEQAGMIRRGAGQPADGEDAEMMTEGMARKAAVRELVRKSDQVSFLSSLTLVYRAIPPGFGGGAGSTFTGECIETARLAMQTHEECMKLMGSNLWVAASYIHWTILYAPFVPFIVIFCHIIETSDISDLQRLRDFIDSLQPTCPVSVGIEKLHRLFSVLYNVAMLYVEAKSATVPADDDTEMAVPATIGNEFDVYLSALGFMPLDDGSHGGAGGIQHQVPPPPTSSSASPNSTIPRVISRRAMAMQQQQQQQQLGDWFSGNRYMMGLLEEDLSQFNPTTWNTAPPGQWEDDQ